MKEIQLEKGWLARQMKEVREQVDKWPEELKILRNINKDLYINKELDNKKVIN